MKICEKIAITAVSILIVCAIVFFIRKIIKRKTTQNNTLLKFSSYGDDVVSLQKKLNEIIRANGTIYFTTDTTGTSVSELLDEDGFFGRDTQLALLTITGYSYINANDIDKIVYYTQ